MQLKKFIFETIIVALITTGLCVLMFQLFFPEKFTILYSVLPAIFGIINILIFSWLLKVEGASLMKFTNRYLLCTTLKLLGSIFFIVVFLLLNKDKAVPFLSSFLAVYLIFLAHEIIAILNFFKKKEKIESTHNKS